ncbi:hypothetical protein GCM10025865_05150 [Paraoerskovia sediminicola]|uniref:Carboxypeptidase regulatory-like domain-containing protein n=1 Tax=Paraoerskovia sediminicola TaxID=1138587 RepID=A0ABN6X8Z0_9CELL|nr:hypothetical protein [Paraoerskovia sediminicola]BDZ41216.1 hypothetical protein GCM10025865_05150 [Paraoerskovia sediminicola]
MIDDELDAGAPMDACDVATLAAVRELYAVLDPVPRGVAERSAFAMTIAALETEMMNLVGSGPLVGARSDAPVEARTITFTSERLTVMITIGPAGDGVRVDGWVAPGGGFAVELHRPDGVVRTSSDEDGRFVLEEVPHGAASIVVPAHAGEPAVSTPVVEL